MKFLKLDTILLFALIVPFIMTYRLSPGITPLWLFGLIFLGMTGNIVLDTDIVFLKESLIQKIKMGLLWFLIIASIGSAFYAAIIVRHQTTPTYQIHDIILQQEAAIKFLLHGKNPYALTYFDTPLAQWHYSDTDINPALYHFVMEPFYLLFAIPFYLVMGHGFGFFDARVPLFFLFIVLLFFAQRLPKEEETKRSFMMLLAFNPATLGYFLEGRDDIFMYAFFFVGLYFLYKKKFSFSGIFFALSFATKQSAWPFFPFYIVYILHKKKGKNMIKDSLKILIPFLLVFASIVLPFFFWNPQAFLDSTILYLSGSTLHSYPVAGYGLGGLLTEIGIIKDVHKYYPFIIWQVLIGFPLLLYLLSWLWRKATMQRLIIAYGIFLFIFWYMSRYFNNSHLGYLSMVFLTAYFWPEQSAGET
jgi:uncharacterized membrane protein